VKRAPAWCCLAVCLSLAGTGVPHAQGQSTAWLDYGSSPYAQAQPKPPPTTPAKPSPPPPTTPPAVTPGDQLAAAAPTTGLLDVSRLPEISPIVMLGDALGIPSQAFAPPGSAQFPPLPGTTKAGILVPSIRSFKIAEDEAPAPQDRLYFGFNYWDDVNKSVDRRFGGDFKSLSVNRETFGVEKTFLQNDASIGLRLPINTLSADSDFPGLGGTSTDVGDLSIILKFALWYNHHTGDVFSAGLAVTVPTGPDAFAGFENIRSLHETTLQPFIGYRYGVGNFFIHGFSSIDIPTDSRDVTIWFNDVGVGYYLYRNQGSDALVSALVPTFEVHFNDPLNHRGAFNFNDIAGTADTIDLTLGATCVFNRRASLAAAFNAPVTGPRPYDWEFLLQFNWRFGSHEQCCGHSTCCQWTSPSDEIYK
jgi:hypothetical protein